jgi:hypothetical protein
MPLDYHIDHARRLVVATGRGIVTDQHVFAYQREVWSRPDVAGYDELVDMRGVQHIVLPAAASIQELAELSAKMDTAIRSKFAIVAPDNLANALSRIYGAYRWLDDRSTKQVEVFRTMPEALAWLGIDSDFRPPLEYPPESDH